MKLCSPPFSNQGYQRAGLITSDELALIKKVDRQPKAKAESILLSDGPKYAILYLKLLKKIQRTDTMSCILVLIADALAGTNERFREDCRKNYIFLRSRRAHTLVHQGCGDRPRTAIRTATQVRSVLNQLQQTSLTGHADL